MKISRQRGFTLIELLVVIGILSVLLAITLVAINPARQFGLANNTKRNSDTVAILNAIGQYAASNQGNLPTEIANLSPGGVADISDVGANLCDALVPDYLPALPTDPSSDAEDITSCASSYDTGYRVSRDADNRVTVYAPDAELSETIQVTR